ncbi:hypothetical protein ACWCSW_31250, partial [Streptomyces sp. NPDC001675]
MSDQQAGGNPMADDAYQPTGTNEEQEDAAPLDLQDAVDERGYDDILLLRCMPTIPGAVGAFRRSALERVGGMSDDTLA